MGFSHKDWQALSDLAVAAPQRPSLGIRGTTSRFQVGRIFCVGRNYADHAREMGHNPDREPPFFFMKPANCIVLDGGAFPYPSKSQDVHHEIELVVAVGTGGRDIRTADALDHVFGYAVGLDMTRRDLQGEAKKLGRPWDTGKAFDHSAPCSDLVAAADAGDMVRAAIALTVNGQRRQSGDLADMIWSVPEIIAFLSTLFELFPGDLVFTGTPAGVGPVKVGDELVGSVAGLGELRTRVV